MLTNVRDAVGAVLAFRFLRFRGRDLAPLVAIALLARRWWPSGTDHAAEMPFLNVWVWLLAAAFIGALVARAVRLAIPAPRSGRGHPPAPGLAERAAVLAAREAALVAASAAGLVAAVGGAVVVRQSFHPPSFELDVVAAASFAAVVLGGFVGARQPRIGWPSQALVFVVLSLWIARDMEYVLAPLTHWDLFVYVDAATRWLHGGSPYVVHVLTEYPRTPAADFFLYPPPLVPFFAALSKFPTPLMTGGWTLLVFAAGVLAFRVLGLAWGWAVMLGGAPMLVDGVRSGNVANLTFLLFVLATRSGVPLVVNVLFKAQNAVPTLWLVREQRWASLAAGLGVVAAFGLVTLPVVGLETWRAWLLSLGYRTETQVRLPGLYALSLARGLPGVAFAAIAVAAVVAALLLRGRRGLAGLGVAQVVASPSLWAHGFSFALPALLTLESGTLFWLVIGAAADFGSWIWLIAVVGAISLFVSPRAIIADPVHPLAGTDGPWPVHRGRRLESARPLEANRLRPTEQPLPSERMPRTVMAATERRTRRSE